MHSGRARQLILVIVASLACAAILPTTALGAIGDLTFSGCVGELSGCTATTPSDAVENPSAVAVSPDGASVYATANNVVDWFSRTASTGELTFEGCYGEDTGCTATSPASAIDGPDAVAVSPDGTSVYVASLDNGSIDEFSRNPQSGALTFVGCLGSGNCASIAGAPDAVDGASAVAVSPDDKTVYVTGSLSNAVSWFSRATNGTALTFEGCIADNLTGCTTPSPANAVDDPGSVALSADGSNAYVASFGSISSDSNGVVSTFSVSAQNGSLTFKGCAGDDPGQTGCTATTPADALDGAGSVAVSPDGESVYAAAQTSGVLDWFSRNPNVGTLTFEGCYGNDPDAGCTATPSGDVSPFSLTLSPDGDSVYAVTQSPGMVDVFTRASSTGALTFVSCVGDDSAGANCTTTNPADALDGADSAVVSLDGQNVYTTGGIVSSSGVIDEFSRVVLFCQDVAVNVPYETSTPVQLNCSGPPGAKLTYTIVSQPTHGTLSNVTSTGMLSYNPDSGYTGSDSFTYKATDSTGSSNIATVTLTVAGPPPAPVCQNVAVNVPYETATPVQLNCSGPMGAKLTYVIVSQPTHGTLSNVTSAGMLSYNPDSGYTGSDSFTYEATDSTGSSNIATVTLTVSGPPPPPPPPTGVAFTISPDTDPVLSLQTLTFAITNPSPGVTYQWDFGDTDTPTGSASAPFVVRATGATVTYAYPNPPTPPSSPSAACATTAGCPGSAGVYTVRAQALIPGNPTPLEATPQNVVVVQVQPPTASFQVLQTGPSTAATQPVTIVPQATLPESQSGAQDQIDREDFWFNLAPGEKPTGPPDLICLPDGACGHYTGSAFEPSASQLTQEPGELGLGTSAVTEPCGDRTCTATPTGGFEAFSMNFWDAALANIGSPGGPIQTLSPQDSGPSTGTLPPLQTGYPPLTTVPLHEVDGYYGEQGIIGPDCFPGYPDTPYIGTTPNPWFDNFPGTQCELGSEAAISANGYPFGPYDLAQFGVNSFEQLEDQFNFLYNYATVVGVDTDLNSEFGPAIGASPGPDNTTVPRTVTMVAYDSEGVPSAPQTESVPLTPATNPTLQVCVQDVSVPGSGCLNPKKHAPFVVSDKDTLQLVTTGSAGGTDPILYYALQVGQPNIVLRPNYTGNNLSCSAQNPPKGGFKWPGTPPTTGHQSPFPVPAFSDLEAGAFPWHNCGAYEERTVDSNLAPGPLPTSGPNVPVHASAIGRHAARLRHRGAPKSGGYTAPSSGVANPVLITTNPNGLDLTLGQTPQAPSGFGLLDSGYGSGPGIYSVAVAAYDTSGLGAITRIDGLEAQPPVKGGQCLQVQSQPITITDAYATGSDTSQLLGFSGGCVSTVVTPTGDVLMYASTAPVDFDGVPLVAQPGYEIVVYYPNRSIQDVYVVKAGSKGCSIKNTTLKGPKDVPHGCMPPSSSKAGSIYLAPGPGGYTTPPGIGVVTHFDVKQADMWFGARMVGGLPTVGKLAPATNGTPHAVTGCGMYGPDSQKWTPSGALYDGFKVVTKPCVSFTRDNSNGGDNPNNGDSRIAFWDSLPQGFGKSGSPPPSQVVLQGMDRPAVSFLSTNVYGNVARDRRAHRVLDGSPASFVQATPPTRARVADDSTLPGFPPIPSCPPPGPKNGDTFPPNSKSGLAIPTSTDMGPLSLPEGASFCYDSATGDFIGSVKMSVPGPLPLSGVDVGFEIGHGRLIDAGGEISGNVPIGPIIVNDLKFDIQTEPVEVAGAIEASIVDVLDVEAGVIFKPSTPEVLFEGTVGIAGFEFGNFAIDFVKNTVGMHVTIAKDFGPASINVTVKGAMIFSPFAFYLEGSGSACLFICLGVDGLISNEGFAACGSIDLVLVKFSGGFAVIWSGPNSGVHLFVGCDLTPYIPAALQNVMGTALDPGPHGPSTAKQPVLCPIGGGPPPGETCSGSSATLNLHQSGICAPTVTTGCTDRVVAVQVHSLVSGNATGSTPIVTLTAPGGSSKDFREYQTPSTPGYYGFDADAGISGGTSGGQTDEGEGFVEQDPVPIYDTNSMSSYYCPTSSTNTALSAGLNVPSSAQGVNSGRLSPSSSSCTRVTTTTLFVADPGTGLWTLTVDNGSPDVVDVQTADTQPPLKASQFNAAVHKATIGTVCSVPPLLHIKVCTSAVRTDGKTFPLSLIKQHRLLLAPSVEIPPTSSKSLTELGHPSVTDLDVATIDDSRLRAILLKAPAGFQGSIALIDHGPTVDQVIAEAVNTKNIPSAGLPILFEPTPDFGAKHEVEAFLSNSDGAPDKMMVLSTFTSPPLPAPTKPKIVKVTRNGANVDVYFDPGEDPIANGIGLTLSQDDGLDFDDTFTGDALHPIGPPVDGIGLARQAKEYMVTIPDVDPTESISVAITGSNLGRLGATAVRTSIAPEIPSVSERSLLASPETGS